MSGFKQFTLPNHSTIIPDIKEEQSGAQEQGPNKAE